LTSSIRTSKANYFSEAIKSGNNVGELWKHLKGHIKCITIDGKNCDNIDDICNNFNNHFSSVAECGYSSQLKF
jgi:RNAse (barnase) inhibitor barstar